MKDHLTGRQTQVSRKNDTRTRKGSCPLRLPATALLQAQAHTLTQVLMVQHAADSHAYHDGGTIRECMLLCAMSQSRCTHAPVPRGQPAESLTHKQNSNTPHSCSRQPPYAVLSRRRRARQLAPCASCSCRSAARASSSPCTTGSLSSRRLMIARVGSKSPSWLACGCAGRETGAWGQRVLDWQHNVVLPL